MNNKYATYPYSASTSNTPLYEYSANIRNRTKPFGVATAGLLFLVAYGTSIGAPTYTLESSSGQDRVIALYATARNKQKKDIKKQISDIKFYLGISISDLATVLHVKRPAIYDWLEGANPREDNKNRIHSIFQYAEFWRSHCRTPLKKYLRTTLEGEKSLFDLLVSESLDDGKIKDAILNISARAQQDSSDSTPTTNRDKIENSAFDTMSVPVTHRA